LENEMSNRRGGLITTLGIGVLLWMAMAIAAEPATTGSVRDMGSLPPNSPSGAASPGANDPGVRPGDESLTCEQIYAQGAAEVQREQGERNARREEMKAQSAGTAAMMTGAMMTGGLGGTGFAAQKAAESQADRQMAMLGAPQANPRKEHLRQLWMQKHCVKTQE
jgi:hypothetical protein